MGLALSFDIYDLTTRCFLNSVYTLYFLSFFSHTSINSTTSKTMIYTMGGRVYGIYMALITNTVCDVYLIIDQWPYVLYYPLPSPSSS